VTVNPANAATPAFFSPIDLPKDQAPLLFVIVDTEEEFDWSRPFSRESVGVTAIDEVDRLQAVLTPRRVVPTYVVDHPVAATSTSATRLSAFARRGECQIGAHLHPWVTPPAVETLGPHMSYGFNLGADVERQKITRLRTAIVDQIGVEPRVYKAGRYGFGQSTARTLEDLGFDVDVSVNPHMDFTSDGGPSFVGFDARPAWFGAGRRMLEVPCTTGFIGFARRLGESLHRTASTPWLASLRAVGVLARSGTLNRVMLSPEGSTLDEMIDVTQALLADGVRTFSLTFHSPSLKPGCTPYVRSAADRDAFLEAIDRYCDYFLGALGGVASTPADFFDRLVRPASDRGARSARPDTSARSSTHSEAV
jgi:hypothetical protein